MIQSRQEILAINPVFTRLICELQQSFKPNIFKEGDRVWLEEADEASVLTQESAGKLNRENEEEFESMCDTSPFIHTETDRLTLHGNHLLASSKENTAAYLKDVAHLLEQIRVSLKEVDLMVLGVKKTPWRYQDNNYLPVDNALNYLKQKVSSDFNGGFLLSKEQLHEFIPHLFWLVRCNGALPWFYMSFPKARTVITLCKYGVLHFDFYNQKEKEKIMQIATELNFKILASCEDPIDFDSFVKEG